VRTAHCLRKRNCVDFTLAGIGETELLVRRIVVMVPVVASFSDKIVAGRKSPSARYRMDCSAVLVAGAHPQSQGRREPDFLATMLFVIHADSFAIKWLRI